MNDSSLKQQLGYRTWENFGGGKFWRIWRTVGNSPKLSPPIFINASQKFYSGDYNTIHQVVKDKEIMGRDNHEDDVSMPKDNTVILEDGEMNEIDRELEEFKRFCLMTKPLKNRPKIAVQVNLKDLAFKNT